MNPDKSCRRGCFIRNEDDGTFTVVDYPTWSFNKWGGFATGQNEPLPESIPAEKNFPTKEEAQRFCDEENMLVCTGPRDKPADSEQAGY